jgi:hypothetical protein
MLSFSTEFQSWIAPFDLVAETEGLCPDGIRVAKELIDYE